VDLNEGDASLPVAIWKSGTVFEVIHPFVMNDFWWRGFVGGKDSGHRTNLQAWQVVKTPWNIALHINLQVQTLTITCEVEQVREKEVVGCDDSEGDVYYNCFDTAFQQYFKRIDFTGIAAAATQASKATGGDGNNHESTQSATFHDDPHVHTVHSPSHSAQPPYSLRRRTSSRSESLGPAAAVTNDWNTANDGVNYLRKSRPCRVMKTKIEQEQELVVKRNDDNCAYDQD